MERIWPKQTVRDEWYSYRAAIGNSIRKKQFDEGTSLLKGEVKMANVRIYGTTYEIIISYRNYDEYSQKLDAIIDEYGQVGDDIVFFSAPQSIEDPTAE